MILYKNMKIINIMLIVNMVTTITLLSGATLLSTFVNAQTPTTSDLPATIGNESNSDMTLTNNSLPVENATTVSTVLPK